MATTLTINYEVKGIEKNLILTEVNRCIENFRDNYIELNISCSDEIENLILSELIRSTINTVVYIEESETHEFNDYDICNSISRSYHGEGSMLSFSFRKYF